MYIKTKMTHFLILKCGNSFSTNKKFYGNFTFIKVLGLGCIGVVGGWHKFGIVSYFGTNTFFWFGVTCVRTKFLLLYILLVRILQYGVGCVGLH